MKFYYVRSLVTLPSLVTVMSKLTMETMLRSGHYSDFTVTVDGKVYKLHKPILATNSGFFRALIETEENLDRNTHTVTFPKGHLITNRIFDYLVHLWYGYGETSTKFTTLDRGVKEEMCLVCMYLSCETPPIKIEPVFNPRWSCVLYLNIHIVQLWDYRFTTSSNPESCNTWQTSRNTNLPQAFIDTINSIIEQDTNGRLVNYVKELRYGRCDEGYHSTLFINGDVVRSMMEPMGNTIDIKEIILRRIEGLSSYQENQSN